MAKSRFTGMEGSSLVCNRFTIIELFIVISIIAILAAMLLPALNSARRKAQTISCRGNLKQIGQAFSMYAGENKDHYPVGTYDAGFTPLNSWVVSVKEQLHIRGDIPRNSAFACPTQLPFHPNKVYSENNISYGVYYQDRAPFAWGRDFKTYPGCKAGSVKMPSRIIGAADSRSGNTGNQRYLGRFELSSTYYVSLRHAKKANAVFLDGHLGSVSLFDSCLRLHTGIPWAYDGVRENPASGGTVYDYWPYH